MTEHTETGALHAEMCHNMHATCLPELRALKQANCVYLENLSFNSVLKITL